MPVDGDVGAVEADRAVLPVGAEESGGAGAGDEDAQVGRLVRGLLGVAAVGGEDGAVLAPAGVVAGVHQHRGVGAREAGQVADVDEIGDEQGVEIRPAQQVTQRVAAPGVPARRPFGTGGLHTRQPR